MRPLQSPKRTVILSIAKNLNILNGNCLQILHKLFRFAQDDIFQNDKIRSFAKVSNYLLFFILFLLFSSPSVFSQKSKRIEILNADELIFEQTHGENFKRLIGHVKFKHENAIMDCDSAYFYDSRNSIEAFGHVHINQNDSVHLYSDFLRYDGFSKIAYTRGNIKLLHQRATLLTDSLDFDRNTNVAKYYTKGIIYNDEDTLTSDFGYYYSNTSDFYPVKNVVVRNPEFTMFTDSLRYNTEMDKAFFVAPTTVVTDSSELYCENGWYVVQTDIGHFIKNAYLKSKEHELYGDTLFYDKHPGIGEAFHSVKMIDTTNNMIISGDYGKYFEQADSGMVTKNALFIQVDNGDSLFMHADTLMAMSDSSKQYKMVIAFHHVKYYKTDLQGKCDSLSYSLADSIIRMFSKPVIWSDNYQLTADYIEALTDSNGIREIQLFNTGLIIQQQDTNKFDQIKGKKIIAHFNDNEIYQVNVYGNAQSVYYPKDDDAFIGMNNAHSTDMVIRFKNRKVQTVTFLNAPEGTLFPLKQTDKSNAVLTGFQWLDALRPYNKNEIFIWEED